MRNLIKFFFHALPVKAQQYIRYFISFHRFPNLSNPSCFSDKLLYRKLREEIGPDSDYVVLSDKILVKNIVGEIIGNKFIIPTIRTFDTVTCEDLKEIVSNSGPIVAKCNHNSGVVFFLDDSSTQLEFLDAAKRLNIEVKRDYGKLTCERWYSFIKKKILIEPDIRKMYSLDCLLDYKFHVFNDAGNTKIILQVDYDRHTSHNRSFFDENGNYLNFRCKYPSIVSQLDVPENFDEMISLTKLVSDGRDYCRVDFYNLNGHIFFGEITFAHGSGFERFDPPEADFWLGRFWVQKLK